MLCRCQVCFDLVSRSCLEIPRKLADPLRSWVCQLFTNQINSSGISSCERGRGGARAAAAAAAAAVGSCRCMAAKRAGQAIWRAAVIGVKAFSVLHIVFAYGGFPTQVDGPSMFPTFPGKGEWVLAEALPGLADRVKVGDIIISVRPINPRESIIKRVTALEGQEVRVYRRGDVTPRVLTVPPGHIWVEGDNLIVSRDSREYGPVPLALVRGRAFLQFWPEVRRLSQHKA